MCSGGAGVDGRSGEPGNLLQQVPFGVVGEVVARGDGQVGANGGVDLGSQRVPDPADAQLPDVDDPRKHR